MNNKKEFLINNTFCVLFSVQNVPQLCCSWNHPVIIYSNDWFGAKHNAFF